MSERRCFALNYYIYGLTSVGNVREQNEDRILIGKKIISDASGSLSTGAPFIAAVCDGVGGENTGELAAQMCVEKLSEISYRSDVDLKARVTEIHNAVRKYGINNDTSANMQTTLCMLAVDENGDGICVNVGDSRMYRYVNAAIRQISTDQSYRQYIYEHGSDSDLSRMDPKLQNAIVSSVGSLTNEPEIELIPLVTKFGTEPDDMIIIMSDGISDYVSEQQLEIGMGLDLPIGQKLEAIAQLALDNGSVDNLSIIGIKPYITRQELEAITSEDTSKTVNIQDLIKETDKLGDILTLDINEIISGKYEPQQLSEQQSEPQPVADLPTQTASAQETASEQVTEQPQPQIQGTEQAELTEDELAKANAETVAQAIRVIEKQEHPIPDELIEPGDLEKEFLSMVSQLKEPKPEQEQGSDTPEPQHDEKKTDFDLHTVELLHQSASSLARLEKLFGKI